MIDHAKLTRENFDQWLAQQPAKREFDFTEPSACLIASWLKETTDLRAPLCDSVEISYTVSNGDRKHSPLPAWLRQISELAITLNTWFTVAEFREIYGA